MGLWKQHFHWTVLLDWVVLAVTVPTILAVAGLLLFFDQYGGANVCFVIASLFVFAKIAHVASVSRDSTAGRLFFTFVLFGLIGIVIVETVRGVNHWAAKKVAAENAATEKQGTAEILPPTTSDIHVAVKQAPTQTVETKVEHPKPKELSPPSKPDISAEFVAANSPGIAVTNLTPDVVMREPMVTISAWNLDTKVNLPGFAYTEKGGFVKKGTAVIIGSFDNPNMKSLIKVGDHVLGLVTVDCPDCLTAKYYWVFFAYGGESWYSPIPVGTTINIMEITRSMNAAKWNVDEFMKLVPHGDRLAPRKL
jgi:hypothetical protein